MLSPDLSVVTTTEPYLTARDFMSILTISVVVEDIDAPLDPEISAADSRARDAWCD
jgi:hypothetical protein